MLQNGGNYLGIAAEAQGLKKVLQNPGENEFFFKCSKKDSQKREAGEIPYVRILERDNSLSNRKEFGIYSIFRSSKIQIVPISEFAETQYRQYIQRTILFLNATLVIEYIILQLL